MDDSHREEEDIDLFDDPGEGEESESTPSQEDDSDAGKQLSDEDFLKRVNEIEGRNYKSVEDYQKTVKERAKAFAEAGRKKSESDSAQNQDNNSGNRQPQASQTVLKNLYFGANPEAQEVWDEVEKEAKLLGKDAFDLYESSAYFKGEAKARLEARKADEETKNKIDRPSQGSAKKSGTDIASVKPEEVDKLSPSDKVKWVRMQAENERLRDE